LANYLYSFTLLHCGKPGLPRVARHKIASGSGPSAFSHSLGTELTLVELSLPDAVETLKLFLMPMAKVGALERETCMLPAAPGKEFARNGLLTHDEMLAAGIGTRVVADLVRRGEIVRVARNLSVQRGTNSHGWLDHAIVCKISGGVLRGPTAGTIHGLTDDIPHPSTSSSRRAGGSSPARRVPSSARGARARPATSRSASRKYASMIETIREAFSLGWRVRMRCSFGPRDRMKRIRECDFRCELDLQTLVCTRDAAVAAPRAPEVPAV
jgi:hypothetical protein